MGRTIHADRKQLMLLPPSIDQFVPEDDSVRFVADFVAALDLPSMGFADPDPSDPGAPAYSAEMLLSVWLYGYMRRIRSTRQLEIACRERMALLWLTGMQYPDHNTLWRFFRGHRESIRGVFAKLVVLAHGAGLVGMVAHALDGTKMIAAASTEKALHRDTLRERLTEVTRAIEEIEAQIVATQEQETGESRLPADLATTKARKALIEEQLKTLAEAGVDHLNVNEPEARVMNVRGSGSRLSYNAQATADENGLVVAIDVTSDAIDFEQLTPMLEQAAQTLGQRPEQTLVDGGYASARSLETAQNANHSVVVPDGALNNAEADPSNPYDKVHFVYDRERDVYICPLGEVLPFVRLTRDRPNSPEKAIYRCRNRACPVKAQCTKDKLGRSIKRSVHDAAIDRQKAMQRDPSVASLYALRKVLIEPLFAHVKWVDGFRRFTMRGLKSARAQWSMICTAVNLRKLMPHWRAGALLSSA